MRIRYREEKCEEKDSDCRRAGGAWDGSGREAPALRGTWWACRSRMKRGGYGFRSVGGAGLTNHRAQREGWTDVSRSVRGLRRREKQQLCGRLRLLQVKSLCNGRLAMRCNCSTIETLGVELRGVVTVGGFAASDFEGAPSCWTPRRDRTQQVLGRAWQAVRRLVGLSQQVAANWSDGGGHGGAPRFFAAP
ncbi:uncharacterized protein BDR25DRAFT_81472 [Lindgomyces ingoldianus]|uniref:Uncharacterized protein n=1 Tax=Lindgomyces ingoldianus TaxID=673940 RepID=A0ACB6QIK8_9PLEO|nr:uncharacterized protein BDR25DRAFT_81472 [Lindgomyces ingoldianus]KAF2465952.1 hypothetical protein BDR25DRAFT_81472 [Lindgomyces ingoldianus]